MQGVPGSGPVHNGICVGLQMKRILVIDDEEWLREMVKVALSQRGYDVIEAENGVVGVEVAQRTLPDLILCDVNMDKMNGFAALSALRNQPATASIPFILMTGLTDQAGMRYGMELGADDYLYKPFLVEALYAAVEARLKKAQTVRDEAEKKLADLRDNLSLMLPHELRTPLNGILAYGEILATEAPTLGATEVSEMGKVIHESGKRLERLVENFLIYAHIELLGADPQKIAALRQQRTAAPAAFIQGRAQAQAQAANREADLELRVADLPLPLSEDHLGKILDELVQNAFKFSEPGTPVRVELQETPNALSLTVADQGRGFSTEHMTKVGAYMQFERKLHEQQGLGLGLSIAKRLTELHGGTLGIESLRGSHTLVTLRFSRNGS